MKRWLMHHLKDEEIQKYLKFGMIPLVAVVLIAVILILDKPAGSSVQEGRESQETMAETTAPVPAADPQLEAKLVTPLVQDSVPEIQTLMETYFQARISCDPQVLSQIFEAGSLGDEAELIERMALQTEYIETYQNISCYTKEGLEADSYLVFTKFDIKFYKTDTLAPSLLWCYVKKSEDGSYRIVEVPDEKTSRYIAEVEKTDEVIALAKEVNEALAAAIASDGKLATIYNVLRAGVTESEAVEGETAESEITESTAALESTTAQESTAAAESVPAESSAAESGTETAAAQ